MQHCMLFYITVCTYILYSTVLATVHVRLGNNLQAREQNGGILCTVTKANIEKA